jgi:D-sedoheptulose 7-phosphate isomerase
MRAAAELWTGYADTITAGLRDMIVTDAGGGPVPTQEAFARWVAMTHTLRQRDGQLFIIGNGGSAAIASHMVTDAVAIAHLRANALNDPTMLTAAANDLSFEQTFALQLEHLARPGDLVIAISQSGNSGNIVRAVEASRPRDIRTITLSAMRADNRCRAAGDLNFYVPLARYGLAQSAHQVDLHYWFDQYLDHHGQGAV